MKYIASVSFGKDSLAMLLLLIKKGEPLDEVVFYDTGKEFRAIYAMRDKVLPILKARNIQYTELHPEMSFDYKMFEMPVIKRNERKCENCKYYKQISLDGGICNNPQSRFYLKDDADSEALPNNKNLARMGACKFLELKEYTKHGYNWCGGTCRWGTTDKLQALERYCKGHIEYVGIAVDEPIRLEKERKGNKRFPLAEWNITESEALQICYDYDFDWMENDVKLYDILDRVSCWCCRNKNLKELQGIYLNLPDYWEKLKAIEQQLGEPMKKSGTLPELEKRYAEIGSFNKKGRARHVSIKNYA